MKSVLFSVILTLSMGLSLLLAQDYQQIAPKVPAPSGQGAVSEPEPPLAESTGSEAVLLPELKGLVFVSGPSEVKAEGAGITSGIDLKAAVPEPEIYKKLATAYLGQKLTKGKLDALIRETVLYYRAHDRPVVDVIVPEQDITNGVVQILILEGHVGKVGATGNRWFSSNILTGDLHATPGDTIRASRLQSDLDWINQNPFRSANLLFSPGAQLGETDLTLQVRDRFPVRFYAGYEDSGNMITGYDRYITGVNLGDVFGLGHQANYQYTSSGDFETVQGHAGSYIIPLPWRHNLTFFGSYSTSKVDLNPITLGGVSWQASTRYEIPLEVVTIEEVGKLRQSFNAGFDFKQSNNNLGFGGSQVFSTITDVVQWVAGYKLTLNDPYGITSVAANVTYSPGNITENNNNAAFLAQRANALANYAYETFTAERNTRLPWDFSWILRGTVQVTNQNLLGSEQLGFGGYNSIRGYDMSEVSADEGFIFTTELRTPSVSIASLFGDKAEKATDDQLQFLVFWDYGQANNYNLAPGESSTTCLSSVGPGLRYTINTYMSLRFDYGWQLNGLGLDQHRGSRGDLGLVISY